MDGLKIMSTLRASRIAETNETEITPLMRTPAEPNELSAYANVFAQTRSADQIFDYRISMPFFGRRYYFRCFAGNERRAPVRLAAEGQSGIAKTSIAAAIAVWTFVSMAFFGTAVFLYLVKSAMGVDLFEGPSPLHFVFFS